MNLINHSVNTTMDNNENNKEIVKNPERSFRRAYATEADRLASEEAERKAEGEIFDREWSKLEKSRLSKIRHGFKASPIFFGIAFIIYITVILILSIVKTDFPFFNGALIIICLCILHRFSDILCSDQASRVMIADFLQS